MNSPITQAAVKAILHYDPDTGDFTYLVDSGARKVAGKKAGTFGATRKCIYISIKRKRYLAHRLAWLYVYGVWPELTIDHIDGDPSNNRLSNLRLATAAQQQQNLRTPKGSNPFVGVHHVKRGNKWAARINGKHLGYAKTAEEAHAIYLAAKQLLHTHHPK